MKTVIFKSYNKNSIIVCEKCLIKTLKRRSIPFLVFRKPTKTKSLTLLKSPHVYKKFKEHYSKSIFSSSLKIDTNTQGLTSLLSTLNINKNQVTFEIKS